MRIGLHIPLSLLAILTLISLYSNIGPAPTHGSPSPLAAFTYDPCVLCVPPGDLVSFQGNWSVAMSGSIASYIWDFGDGTPPVKTSDPFVSHLYGGTTEEWLVTLTVTDSNGLTDTVSQLVLFYVVPRFTFQPSKPVAGMPVLFNASASISYQSGINPIMGYAWNFGDGTIGNGVVVTHAYKAAGVYRVMLALNTSSGNPSISKTLIVGPNGSVGGQTLPIDRLGLVLPYLTLGGLVVATTLFGIYLGRKWQHHIEITGEVWLDSANWKLTLPNSVTLNAPWNRRTCDGTFTKGAGG